MATSTTATAESLGVKALSAIPVVGPILSQLAGTVIGIFGASHSAAVAQEASTLNTASPAFLSQCQAIMAAAENDQITSTQAITYLQQAQATYYSTVAGIIHGAHSCTPTCAYTGGSSQPVHYCSTSGSCNAACAIACILIEPTVRALTAILKAGAGSYTTPPTPNNGAIQGTPAVQFNYSAPSVLKKIETYIFGEFAKL